MEKVDLVYIEIITDKKGNVTLKRVPWNMTDDEFSEWLHWNKIQGRQLSQLKKLNDEVEIKRDGEGKG